MIRQTAAAVALVALGVLLATALRPTEAARARPPEDTGRYQIVAGQSSFVLYDTVGGLSWVLQPQPQDKSFAWLPTKRINTEAEALKWRITNRQSDAAPK